jgi:hypothetical protein
MRDAYKPKPATGLARLGMRRRQRQYVRAALGCIVIVAVSIGAGWAFVHGIAIEAERQEVVREARR